MSTAIEKLTLEEYLELEQRTGQRHEFQNGEATPMVGGSRIHSKIIAQIAAELIQRFKGTKHEVHVADMRYYAPESQKYTFPDIVVPDEPAHFHQTCRHTYESIARRGSPFTLHSHLRPNRKV